jgi:hypothetical protein
MEVVFHHIGRPRHSTISQNDRIMWLRRRISDGFSGGGSFLACVPLLAATVSAPAAGFWGSAAPSSSGC